MSGRGASNAGRSHTVRSGGLHSSENAGMSSENYVGIIMAENLRFPGEGFGAAAPVHNCCFWYGKNLYFTQIALDKFGKQ